ncbi:hypothetical protein [Burkholderia anthina]|uniref:hypothetical protein n=1 Tax=Burkholderia anthina TaxID=179879 RepID=UPI0037C02D4D
MRTTTTQDHRTTHNAGVPPAPSENAQPRAAMEGDKRVVKLNGAVITMLYTAAGWINVKVA